MEITLSSFMWGFDLETFLSVLLLSSIFFIVTNTVFKVVKYIPLQLFVPSCL